MSVLAAPVETAMTPLLHTPVLINEVVAAFDFGRSAVVLDGTLGLGGHSEALATRYRDLRIIGLEWDEQANSAARERLAGFGARVSTNKASYTKTADILAREGLDGVDGFLLDLGLSSFQLDDRERGFSFLRPGPFDMRMSPKQ